MAKILNVLPDQCTGCMQCQLACAWVQTGCFQPSKSVLRVQVFDEQASYAPHACVQCDEAWCMTTCPVNAITVDETTEAKVVIEERCIGCHLCTIACPFGAVFTLPEQDHGRASKCNLCGGQPACVTVCPTEAIEYVEAERGGAWYESWGGRVNEKLLKAMDGSPDGSTSLMKHKM